MNLMVASEKHGLIIFGVDHELWVYKLDPVTIKFIDSKPIKISLQNDLVIYVFINNYSKK
jgi:hypothetical protein